jgi:tagatose-6-phosphate ketose/aldose isomerase
MGWLLTPLLLFCLAACVSSGDDNDIVDPTNTDKTSSTKLYIYVYAPQEAQSTRAYEGDVDPITNESSVYSLQIWVFGNTSHKLLGYYASLAHGLTPDAPSVSGNIHRVVEGVTIYE